MTGLDTSEAGTAEHVVDHDPGLLHGLTHQLGLHRPDHSQRTVSREAVRSVSSGRNRRRHVQIFPLISPVFVETVRDPAAEGEVNPLPVTCDENLSRTKRSTRETYI